MSYKTEQKRELILDKAKQVFIQKGFHRTTMLDIIKECRISRGGIYLYYSSVDEIFVEVVKKHNLEKKEDILLSIEKSTEFVQLVDLFFEGQKEKLLHMDQSLYAAMLEFCSSHKNKSDKDFYAEQFTNNREIILEMLSFGQNETKVQIEDREILADSMMLLIEGMRSMAVSSGITPELVESQLNVCKKRIISSFSLEREG